MGLNALPRVTWLLDGTRRTSTATMVARRARLLRARLRSTVLALGEGRARPDAVPAGRADSAEGSRALAEADLVVTTSPRTLDYACTHRGTARVLHFAHMPAGWLVTNEQFQRHAERVGLLAVPSSYDVGDVTAATGIGADRVRVQDDFTLAGHTLPARAAGRVVTAAGALTHSGGIAALLEGFALALADLPGWQLRLLAAGRLADTLAERIAELGLADRVAWLRHGADLACAHAGSGVAVRLSTEEAYGLPVLDAPSSGLPVIGGAAVPAVQRYVEDERNGLVLPRTDPETIAAALVRFGDHRFRTARAAEAARMPGGQLDEAGAAGVHELFEAALSVHAA